MNEHSSPIQLSMLSPQREQCGITDYSRFLTEALSKLPDIHLARNVEPPGREGGGAARSAALLLCLPPAQIAHIQHQYFFFGGVAPYRSSFSTFLKYLSLPAVMTVHEITVSSPASSILVRLGIRIANRAAFLSHKLNCLIVHTAADKDTLVDLGRPKDTIEVVTHGVPKASPMPSITEAKAELGLTGKKVVTLFGFLSRKKGHSLALEALSSLPEDTYILLAGGRHPDDQTDYAASLQNQIESLGLQSRARITGYLSESEIPVFMAATDLAIAPFLQSSGSGSLANLLAYGRAILASDIPPHQEIASRQPSCLTLFRSADVQDFVNQAQVLLESKQLREMLQQASLNYAGCHSYLEMAKESAAIYSRIRRGD